MKLTNTLLALTAMTQAARAGRGDRPGDQSAIRVATGFRDLSSQAAVGTPIALCMDGSTPLRVEILTATPTIVDYGWDGARSASAFVTPVSRSLSLAAPPQRGMRQLTTRPVVAGTAAAVVVQKS